MSAVISESASLAFIIMFCTSSLFGKCGVGEAFIDAPSVSVLKFEPPFGNKMYAPAINKSAATSSPAPIFLRSHSVWTISPSNTLSLLIFELAISYIILYNQLMDLKTLEERIKKLNTPKVDYSLNSPREKEILTRTVKLNEEVGELCNDILSILKLQRKAKLEKFDKRSMYQEFADVLITLIQLAVSANVDLDRAVRDKLQTISERIEKEKNRKP